MCHVDIIKVWQSKQNRFNTVIYWISQVIYTTGPVFIITILYWTFDKSNLIYERVIGDYWLHQIQYVAQWNFETLLISGSGFTPFIFCPGPVNTMIPQNSCLLFCDDINRSIINLWGIKYIMCMMKSKNIK